LYVVAIESVQLATKQRAFHWYNLDGSRLVSRRNNTVAVGSAACEESRVWLVLQLAASARRRPRLRYLSIALWILNPDRTVGYRYEARARGFARMFCRLHGGCSLPLSLASTKELAVAEDKLK
jgi:hypothetical protein